MLHNKIVGNIINMPDLCIPEPLIAIKLLRSLTTHYLATVHTTLVSFKTIKLARVYNLLSM